MSLPKPYYSKAGATLYCGDALTVLREMESESVHCVVTSPPYWGLRTYLPDAVRIKKDAPPHVLEELESLGIVTISSTPSGTKAVNTYRKSDIPAHLLAYFEPAELGLEATPTEYVARMVQVFREVRRVLRSDGTLWLVVGDSYHGGGGGNYGDSKSTRTHAEHLTNVRNKIDLPGLKPKDLVGIPWRLAFALQADGWVLRQEIIWQKPNPMPESVQNRCTKAHEQIFMFAKAKWVGPSPGRFAHISDQDARWLALAIDTEGSIIAKRVKQNGRADSYDSQVSFGNTNRTLTDELVRIVGHGNILERPGKNARMWFWQVGSNIAKELLHRIYPFLIVKGRQARICMHLNNQLYRRGGQKPERKQRTEKEDAYLRSLWERNKACNQFGDPCLDDVPFPEYGKWSACHKYHYDAEAIKEPANDTGRVNGREGRIDTPQARPPGSSPRTLARLDYTERGRNKRSVWTVATAPYAQAHFATFPPKLIEPCILAGCPEKTCAKCRAPWVCIVEKTNEEQTSMKGSTFEGGKTGARDGGNRTQKGKRYVSKAGSPKPACGCNAATVPGVVLDPFAGSGTTVLVAQELGCRGIGIDLNPDYCELAKKRVRKYIQKSVPY